MEQIYFFNDERKQLHYFYNYSMNPKNKLDSNEIFWIMKNLKSSLKCENTFNEDYYPYWEQLINKLVSTTSFKHSKISQDIFWERMNEIFTINADLALALSISAISIIITRATKNPDMALVRVEYLQIIVEQGQNFNFDSSSLLEAYEECDFHFTRTKVLKKLIKLSCNNPEFNDFAKADLQGAIKQVEHLTALEIYHDHIIEHVKV